MKSILKKLAPRVTREILGAVEGGVPAATALVAANSEPKITVTSDFNKRLLGRKITFECTLSDYLSSDKVVKIHRDFHIDLTYC